MIDLHVHSAFSDGCDTPGELVGAAALSGVAALALTDHDTTAGVGDFLAACRRQGVTGFAGVELSAQVQSGTLHVLGLGIDPACGTLGDALTRIRQSRDERNHRILEKLRDLGFGLTWDEVQSIAGNDVVGRPHFARAMIARGWAENAQEVFERYLERGAPAYAERLKPSPAEAVRLVASAGGVPVVAHPLSWFDDLGELERGLSSLKEAGLAGLECYHASHGDGDVVELLRLASKLGLLATGGSDYHGEEVRPGVRIGRGTGSLLVPDRLLPPLVGRMSPNGCVFAKEALP